VMGDGGGGRAGVWDVNFLTEWFPT
jgi:hypothetical protein